MVAGLFATCLLSLLLPIIVLAGPHDSRFVHRHHDLARRAAGHVQLYRRSFTDARMTFYNTNTGNDGSCGTELSDNDFTVAMNTAQMSGTLCFQLIFITYGAQTATATIADTCPGCPYKGLDLTYALFSFFAPQSVGVIYGEWEFAADAAPPAPAPAPSPTPSPSPPPPSPTPTSTSSYVPPPPSSISTPSISISTWSSLSPSSTPTSTYSHTGTHNSTAARNSSSSATPSVSINFSSGAASGLALPTGTIAAAPGTVDNIQNLFNALIQMDSMMVVAHSV